MGKHNSICPPYKPTNQEAVAGLKTSCLKPVVAGTKKGLAK